MTGGSLEDAGFVVGAAGEVDGAVLRGHQPVADVGVEGVGAAKLDRYGEAMLAVLSTNG